MTKYNSLFDQQLWDLLKSGDHSAYAEIYERYFSVLYMHARKRLRNTQEAEDVIQEVFLDIWNNSSKIIIKSSLINYLISCTRNRVLNLISRSNLEIRYRATLTIDNSFEEMADHLVREKMLNKIIMEEIDSLPPKMRRVFLMSRAEHLTYTEISKNLDITEQSVRSHVKNALKVLRVKLGMLFYVLLILLK